MKKRLFATFSLVVLFIFIMVGIAIVNVRDSSAMQSVEIPSVITTTMIYTVNLPIVTTASTYRYFDNYDDPTSGWPVTDSGAVRMGYQSGEYEISINNSFKWGGAVPPMDDISNYSVEAIGHLQQGSSGAYGLIFDRVDWNHYYLFAVLPATGEFVLFRHDPAWVEIVPFSSSPLINSGSESNHLRVERYGEAINLYINDQFLVSTSDGSYSGTNSEVGLFAQTLEEISMAVRFDNFLVVGVSAAASERSQNTEETDVILIGKGQSAIYHRR
jgi:hypothetical protein